MNPLHLLWIVPLAIVVGAVIGLAVGFFWTACVLAALDKNH